MNVEKLFHIHKYGEAWLAEWEKTVMLRKLAENMNDMYDYPGARPDQIIMSPDMAKAYQKILATPKGEMAMSPQYGKKVGSI